MNRDRSQPKLLLHLEGAVVFAAAVAAYIHTGGDGWAFALLLLAPDLSMLGYLAGPRAGALVYNLAHNYAPPAALLAFGLASGGALWGHVGLIWLAHIGMDRAVGYGLKYASGFKDTHMAHV